MMRGNPHCEPNLQAAQQRRCPRPVWLWLIAIPLLVALMLWARSAAAQTDRGMQIIEQALSLQPNTANGATMYRELCASCHGETAQGDAPAATPALAGQLQTYVIKQLADFAEGDRVTVDMHRVVAVKRLSTPQAMRDLASHMNGLRPNPAPEHGDGEQLALGARIYQKTCAQCHGVQGEGEARHAVPSLQHQHYSYLLTQMRRLAVGHRYSVDIEVIEILEALSFDQLISVADFISRLPVPVDEPVAANSRRGKPAYDRWKPRMDVQVAAAHAQLEVQTTPPRRDP